MSRGFLTGLYRRYYMSSVDAWRSVAGSQSERQTEVTAYLNSKQLLSFASAPSWSYLLSYRQSPCHFRSHRPELPVWSRRLGSGSCLSPLPGTGRNVLPPWTGACRGHFSGHRDPPNQGRTRVGSACWVHTADTRALPPRPPPAKTPIIKGCHVQSGGAASVLWSGESVPPT